MPNLFQYVKGGEYYSHQPSRNYLHKILEVLSPVIEKNFDNNKTISNIYSYLRSISDLFIFVTIKEINKKIDKTYGLNIDYINSYIGNGLINRN